MFHHLQLFNFNVATRIVLTALPMQSIPIHPHKITLNTYTMTTHVANTVSYTRIPLVYETSVPSLDASSSFYIVQCVYASHHIQTSIVLFCGDGENRTRVLHISTIYHTIILLILPQLELSLTLPLLLQAFLSG